MRYALAGLLVPLSIAGGPINSGPSMAFPRAAHTATLLFSGKVLVAGGCTEPSCELSADGATTELYDPRVNRFVRGPRMSRPRVSHTATRLPNGDVLVAGGWEGREVTASAELYVAATGRFVPVGSMRDARGGSVAVHLGRGRVLIFGGTGQKGVLRTAEIFDARTRSFARVGSMSVARGGHSAVKLVGGKVLVTGGADGGGRVLRSAELFDPRASRFRRVGRMQTARHKHASVSHQGSGALIFGGSDERDFRGRYASVEYFDVRRGTFRYLRPMLNPRFKFDGTAIPLSYSNVLLAGGADAVELYSLKRGPHRLGRTGERLAFGTATRLRHGILLAGGYDDGIQVSRSTWLIRP